MTPTETAKLVAVLLQVYPQAQFGPASSAMYERLLSDLDFATATAAVDRLARTSKWLPTVAEIRAVEVEIRCGPKKLGAEAWGDAVEAVRRFGVYRSPKFSDPLVAECVRLMGWRNLCASENGAADRARFIELYDGLQERGRLDVIAGRALPPASAPTLQLVADLARRLGQ